ncbi:insulinase family protein [Cyclobacteriaceae bacterium]|nr:insulinase family protein [Cyclobacteriaceae bacterium]
MTNLLTQNPTTFDYRNEFFRLSTIEQTEQKGIQVFALRDESIDISYIELLFFKGKLDGFSTAISTYLSDLFTHLISAEGHPLFEEIEFRGARTSIEIGATTTSLKVYALKEHLPHLYTQIVQLLVKPQIKESSFQLVKENIFKDIETEKLQKESKLSEVSSTYFYADSELRKQLTSEDVNLVELHSLLTAFQSLLTSLNSVFSVNVDYVDLSVFQSETQKRPITLQQKTKQVLLYPKLNTEQSLLHNTHFSCKLNDPKYADYYFFNQVYGGSFQSVLSQEIREKQGLTYGIHSSLMSFGEQSVLKVKSTTPYQKAIKVQEEIVNIQLGFERFLDEQYIEDLKKTATVTFLRSMESVFSQLNLHRNIYLKNLAPTFYGDLLEGLKKCTIDDLLSVNKELQTQPSLRIIVE